MQRLLERDAELRQLGGLAQRGEGRLTLPPPVSIARLLVDHPEKVQVEEYEEDDGTLVLELSVDEDDYGQVIGRGGRTAQALRTVVKAAAVKDNRRVLVDIVE